MNRRLSQVICLIGTLWYPGCGWTQSDLSRTREQSPETSSYVIAPRKLQFQLHRGYLVIVKGLVGQTLEVNFLVDTGAYPSVIDLEVAASLRLAKRPAHVNLTRQTFETHTVVLPSLCAFVAARSAGPTSERLSMRCPSAPIAVATAAHEGCRSRFTPRKRRA